MVLRHLENFLQAVEVRRVWSLEAQKVLKIMDFHFLTRSGGKAEDEIWHNRAETLTWVEILQNDTSSLGTALVTRSVRPPEHISDIFKCIRDTLRSLRAIFWCNGWFFSGNHQNFWTEKMAKIWPKIAIFLLGFDFFCKSVKINKLTFYKYFPPFFVFIIFSRFHTIFQKFRNAPPH